MNKYSFGKILSNPIGALRNKDQVLIPGDIVSLYGDATASQFNTGSIGYHGYKIQSISGKYLGPLDQYAEFNDSVIGLDVIVRATFTSHYGKKFTIIGINKISISPRNVLTEAVIRDNENEVRMCVHFLEIFKSKCVCNFYEREAYGCTCGRIVG